MTTLDHLRRIAEQNFDAAKPGGYYGSSKGMALGAGLVYSGVQVPLFNEDLDAFEVIDATVLVLTNECDVANERLFNTHVLVCPVIDLQEFADAVDATVGIDRGAELVRNAAANNVFRVFYLPPAPDLFAVEELRNGGFLYLNQICSVHVSLFRREQVTQLCALTSYASARLDHKLENHLLRPKDEALPRIF